MRKKCEKQFFLPTLSVEVFVLEGPANHHNRIREPVFALALLLCSLYCD